MGTLLEELHAHNVAFSLWCRVPTPMMKQSLLYKLTQFGYNKEVTLDNNRFTHAFTSKFGKCRVFKVCCLPPSPSPKCAFGVVP